MFIRTKRSKTATAIQIVENHRDGGKTIQRVIRQVGSAHINLMAVGLRHGVSI